MGRYYENIQFVRYGVNSKSYCLGGDGAYLYGVNEFSDYLSGVGVYDLRFLGGVALTHLSSVDFGLF